MWRIVDVKRFLVIENVLNERSPDTIGAKKTLKTFWERRVSVDAIFFIFSQRIKFKIDYAFQW